MKRSHLNLIMWLLFILVIAASGLTLTMHTTSSFIDLHSGSDVRGVVGETSPLSFTAAFYIGRAFAARACSSTSTSTSTSTIVIGYDPRSHSSSLSEHFALGARFQGAQVTSTKLSTTPAQCYFARSSLYAFSVMVTASHLPRDKNGFKFFVRDDSSGQNSARGLTSSEIVALLLHADKMREEDGATEQSQSQSPSFAPPKFTPPITDLIPSYLKYLTQSFPLLAADNSNIKQLKVVVNSGSGSGFILADLLTSLGAQTFKMHCTPDPNFPPRGDPPNPECELMTADTRLRCQEVAADVGILFDTDADRVGFLLPNKHDGSYEVVNKNRLIALLAALLPSSSSNNNEKHVIVTDSTTSEGLTKFLEQHNCVHTRHLKGYNNVIGKGKVLNAAIAIETSGHCAMRSNDYSDDGMFTAMFILNELVQHPKTNPLEQLINLEEVSERAKCASFDEDDMRASERSEQQKASKSQLVLCCWLALLASLDEDEHAGHH